MKTPSERLKDARIKAGFNSARSAALHFKWPESTYAGHENGSYPIPLKAAKKYADALNSSASWILMGEGSPEAKSKSNVHQLFGNVQKLSGDEPLFAGVDLPVFASAECGEGCLIVSNEPYEYVSRPAFLAHVPDAYAVRAVSESMIPEFWPDDIIIIHPRLPIVKNESYIFRTEGVSGEWKAAIKHLIGQTADEWLVKQWNPPEGDKAEFKLKKSDWPKCHRVCGKFSF